MKPSVRLPSLLLTSLSLLLAGGGCSDRDQGGSPTGGQDGADRQQLLADAPADWAAFLGWAEQKLQTQTATVPLPVSPELSEPRWALLRLDDPLAFRKAGKTSDWTAPLPGTGALAELGPFRSDQPGPDFTVEPAAGRLAADGKPGLALHIERIPILCEDVGSIEMKLSVPFGEHVTLAWSKAGVLLVPVESNEKSFTIRVLTDGFAEWEGPLERFSLLTDGLGPGVVQIHSLRFLPRQSSYPAAVGIKRVRLGDEIRTAIYAHCPAGLTYEGVVLPADAKLDVGLGCVAGTAPEPASAADIGQLPSRTAAFRVLVACDGQEYVALAQELEPAAAWTDVSVSLAQWAGREVTLSLSCASPLPGTVAFWGNPVVYQPVERPPLLVIYLIDTVAAEHIDFYGTGYTRSTMPRLATMAARGVWFARAFSNSSRTIESIPDLMLSMPTERHGVHHNSTPAPEGLVTIADALRAAGFATVSFCTNVNAGPRQRMDQGFDTFVDKIGYYWTDVDRTIPLEEVMAWIGRHRDRPMFLYIHTAEPHAPYTPPQGFAGRFDADYQGSIDGTYNRATTFHRIRDPVTQRRDLQHVVALYDEEILYSDFRFGLFLDALHQQNLLEKATFFVTSDHGEEFLEHGLWEHGTDVHNEQTRIPLVAFGPSFRAGMRVDLPVQLLDVLPTILDLFDLPAPYPLCGHSLLSLLLENPDTTQLAATTEAFRSRPVYASNHNYRISHNLIEYSVVAGGRWKLLYGWREFPMYAGGPRSHFLLFDLEADAFERQNLIYQQPNVARRLAEDLVCWRLSQHVYDSGVWAPTEIDAAHMRELEALGYLGGNDKEADEPNAAQDPRGAPRP